MSYLVKNYGISKNGKKALKNNMRIYEFKEGLTCFINNNKVLLERFKHKIKIDENTLTDREFYKAGEIVLQDCGEWHHGTNGNQIKYFKIVELKDFA